VSQRVDYLDGEWHRLHPATPLLRGGITLLAVIGVIIANQRDAILGSIFDAPSEEDPIDMILHSNFALIAGAVVVGGLVLFVAGFYVSWRMHSFRITNEAVEVRSGILFRTHRKARLDRIQGINIVRPFVARLFGAARLEVSVAGQNGNVQLAYLGSVDADDLRREVLRLASGTQQASAPAAARDGSIVEQRVAELLAPELDVATEQPVSVVALNMGRVIGSLLLSNTTVFVIVGIAVLVTTTVAVGSPVVVFGIVPMVIGVATFYWSRFVRSLRYTISRSRDGIRIGWGLLSTTNETLPPGRIHAVELSQPLLWRIAGWWEIKVTLASKSSANGAAGQANTTILPVGSADDALRVLELIYPQFSGETLAAMFSASVGRRREDDGFTTSPRRGAVLRLLSWRRNGFALAEDLVLLRTGAVWRRLAIVPLVRMQSIAVERGPLRSRLRLASLRLHLVTGPVSTSVGAIDLEAARQFFNLAAAEAVRLANEDSSDHWRRHESA
jgi:putative membrane protein